MRPILFYYSTVLLMATLAYGPLKAQVVNIEEQRITGTNDSTHWYGHLRASAALAKVRQQSLQLSGEARVEYKSDPHMVLLLIHESLLRAGGNDFTNLAFAHLRYNYKFNATWVGEIYTQLQTSPLQLLQERRLLGAGLRWRLFKSADSRQRLYAGTSWLWERNHFSGSDVAQYWNRSSNYLSLTLRAGKQSSLTGTTYWQPVWGLIRNYRVSTTWVLKIALTKKVALNIDFTYYVDKNLPAGAPAETYSWRNGVTWQLK